MERLKEVLAFVNNKGGVGKTTTVQNVAAGILRFDKHARVLVIDLDPQGNLSFLMGWETERKQYNGNYTTIADALRRGDEGCMPVFKKQDRWYYVPASPELANIDPDLHRQMNSKLVLCDVFGNDLIYYNDGRQQDAVLEGLTNITESFDYVLIDCAPALSELTYNALGAADGMIIPVQLEGLSVNGVGKVIKAAQDVHKKLNEDLQVRGMLLTMADERMNVTKELTQYLRDSFCDIVFKSRIRQCAKMREAQLQLKDIFAYAPYCNTGKDYAAFVKELFNTKK